VPADGRIEVRSYRTVFDLDRRLYRIDRVRLNPGGVPVRGIVYGVVLTAAVAVLAALPLLGWPLRALPWPARHLVLPTVVAAALTVVRVDGRPCHVALRSVIALAVGPRRLNGWERVPRSAKRWRPPDLVVIPDGSEPSLRRACFHGPGAVVVRVAHELRRRHGHRVTLRPSRNGREASRKVVVLAAGSRLDVHPAPRR
jgi:hypothetical protein